ncbi:CYTH domain-containing protein [Phormidesmis priestleyi ULC007]|uniref:CYTH domain-containing protein n=1 Tax=Phormidesmis priestleyi ULC007 TaxID=1920490 RepID=A0A2T1DE33_9CYAN|nr:CYTH domain-containing protein [Phormidesmis priestleyi]PSB18735.1 CYTH domain-containing protein [Phormidesmis priestleyi ULC007]PZO51505.1 MAG: CYTH domain-containing protein [Phormidesmis priestleyi]
MGVEIERKFLVTHDSWHDLAPGVLYRQGYISTQPERTVRVRVAGDRAFITLKGATQGTARSEFEYPIPLEDANEILNVLCVSPLIEKYRHKIELNGLTWEVDEFLGENQGLVIAEVELENADQAIELPDWIGEDVSHDSRYYNSNLVTHPFNRW